MPAGALLSGNPFYISSGMPLDRRQQVARSGAVDGLVIDDALLRQLQGVIERRQSLPRTRRRRAQDLVRDQLLSRQPRAHAGGVIAAAPRQRPRLVRARAAAPVAYRVALGLGVA